MIEKSKPFKEGDKVFGKVKGYPAWPAKITAVNGKRYSVVFYGTNETATLKHENVVYYLKNKQKFSNLQKRKYFAEAIIDIEEDIKNCGGLDGSPTSEDVGPKTANKTSTKRKRRISNVPQNQGDVQHAQDAMADGDAHSSKRFKIEDQNHNEPDAETKLSSQNETLDSDSTAMTISQSNTEITTTQSETDSSAETATEAALISPKTTSDKSTTNNDELTETLTSESITTDSNQYPNKPSTIAEVTENYEDTFKRNEIIENWNKEELCPERLSVNSSEETKLDSVDDIVNNDENIAERPLSDVPKLNLPVAADNNEDDTSAVTDETMCDGVQQLDLKDVYMFSEFYLTSIIIYAERVKENMLYYKKIPSDAVSLDDASDTRLKVLPVKIDNDNYTGLIYVEKGAEHFSCEFDRAMEDAKIAQELLELKSELIHGYASVDDRVMKKLGCDDTYVFNTTNLSIVSYKKSKLQWLQQELEIFKHIVEIKKCLGLNCANTKVALEHMRALLNLPIKVISLKKRSTFVNTIYRLCKYVGSPKTWDYTEDEVTEFEQNAWMIRETADAIFNKIRVLFEYGQHSDFLHRFQQDCDEFNEFTKNMTEAEIFSLCAEPRSRRAQLELIIDEQAINVDNDLMGNILF